MALVSRACFHRSLLFGIFAGALLISAKLHAGESTKSPSSNCFRKSAGSDVVPPDVIQWVSDVSSLALGSDRCETVEIQSSKGIGNDRYWTNGEGTVFSSSREPGKRFILTAAHVVANTDQIQVRCNGKIFSTKIRGSTETKDLAVLEIIGAAAPLHPLFSWDGKKLPVAELFHQLPVDDPDYLPEGSHFIQTSSRFVNPSTLHLARAGKDSLELIPNRYPVKAEIAPTPFDHPLVGSRNAILLKNQGVRPGMSGSPILYQVMVQEPGSSVPMTKTFLSGVIVKTYVNNTVSVAVPVETVSEALPVLMQGLDPAKSKASSYYFEKRMTRTDHGLTEMPEMVFGSGESETRLQAVCPGPFSTVSARGSGDVGGGKSDSGDGDGGKSDSGDGDGDGGKSDSGDGGGKSKSIAQGGYYNSNLYTLFRDRAGCQQTGIKDAQGNTFVAVRDSSGGVTKAVSFDSISQLIQEHGKDFPKYLESHGIKATDPDEAYKSFCSDSSVFDSKGHPRRVRIERRDFNPKDPAAAQFSSSSEIAQGESGFGREQAEVECNSAAKAIRVHFSKNDFDAQLEIKAGSWSGTIRYRGCESKIQNAPKSPWMATYRDGKMDLQMSVSPDRDFLSFDIFGISSSCNTGKSYTDPVIRVNRQSPDPSGVWLSKVDVSLAEPSFVNQPFKDPDSWEESNISDIAKQKHQLAREDERLGEEGIAAVPKNPAKTKEIIQILHNREIEELGKARFGEPVSKRRIGILQLLISRLKNQLN